MKKVIVSAFCSVVLLGTLGGAVAQASELPFANEENTSLLQSVVRSEGIQSRSGYIMASIIASWLELEMLNLDLFLMVWG